MYPNQSMYSMPGYGFRNPMYQQPQVASQPTSAFQQQMAVTPVTGMTQVDAAQAPFDGTPMFFYDTAADAVYIKQFDSSNGTAPVTIYRREPKAAPPQYATVDMVTALAHKVDELSAMFAQEPEPPRQRRTVRKEADPE